MRPRWTTRTSRTCPRFSDDRRFKLPARWLARALFEAPWKCWLREILLSTSGCLFAAPPNELGPRFAREFQSKSRSHLAIGFPIFHVILCRILAWVEHCFCFFHELTRCRLLMSSHGDSAVTPGVRNTEVCRGSSMRRMCRLEKLWLLRVHRRGQVRMEPVVQFSRQIAAQNIGRIGSSIPSDCLQGLIGGPAELEDLWTLAVIPVIPAL
jgi:hypothetical protein